MAMGFSNSCLRMPKCRGIDIEELSILQLQEHLSEAAFTSRELTECYLKRIELLNPRVRAVIETNPDALEIADRLDEERRGGKVRTKIHGIPFVVKDNIASKDKMETTAGSTVLIGTLVLTDARVLTLLRAAGGVLLGKANLSEWASLRASYYAEAYSSRGGQNRNPYNLAHHPGGSSSGSASALASNMCAFSIGTETDGSVMFPADRNAVVGIKPTVGLTSTLGVIPESPSMDTVGTFGRSVEDATIILDIIAEGQVSLESPENHFEPFPTRGRTSQPYTSWLSKQEALKGARFGMPWKRVWESASKSVERKYEYTCLKEAIQKIVKAGAQVIHVDFPSAEEIISPDGWDWEYGAGETGSALSEFEVVRTEFYRSLQSYLGGLAKNDNEIRCLEDVVTYNIQHTDQEGGVPGTHPAWPTGQDNFDRCLDSRNGQDDRYREALAYVRRKSREEGIDAAMKDGEDSLDGLLMPLQADGGVACSVAAKAGYPMITIPIGVNAVGLPFGLGIINKGLRENLLVKYGSAIEDYIRGRKRPNFLNLDADNYTYVGHSPEKTGKV